MISRALMQRQMFAGGGLVQATQQLQGLRQNVNSALDNIIGGNSGFGGGLNVTNYSQYQQTFRPGQDPAAPGVGLSVTPGPMSQYPGMGGASAVGSMGSALGRLGSVANMFGTEPQGFSQGGDVKPGYHRMPDGTMMKNSEHMAYGGDVKKMQMGGEPMAAPSAAPADMSGIAGMLSQAEQSTAQGTQQLGAEYAQNMMSGIEGAEDFKTMIDSIRGNDKPMADRYEELAGYVGPEDAQRTPESVLAMVQPTIMMTEEGAMGSGIGELMQGIAGSVEMETAGGQPTAMGQGVGSMLMAGAPEPVQAFRDGGVVQKFNVGGVASANDPALHEAFYVGNRMSPGFAGQVPMNQPARSATPARVSPTAAVPSLESLYEKNLPMYQKIIGQTDDDKNLAQAQILFDLSRRALAYAGGVSPDTGESVAGKSPAAQAAAALQTLPTSIGAQLSEINKAEKAVKLAALEGASGQREALMKAALETTKLGEGDVLFDSTGQEIARGPAKAKKPIVATPGSQIRDPDDPTKVIGTVPAKPEKPDIQFLTSVDGTTSTAVNLSEPGSLEKVMTFLNDPENKGRFYLDKRPAASPSQEDENYVVNKERLDRIRNGTASEEEIIKFQQLAGGLYKGKTTETVGADGQTVIAKIPAVPMPQQVEEVIRVKFPNLYGSIQREAGGVIDPRVWRPELGDNNIQGAEDYAKKADPIAHSLGMTVYMPFQDGGQPPLEGNDIFPQYDFSKGVGFPGFYNQLANTAVDLFTGRLADEEAASALEVMNSILVDLDQLAIAEFPGGRAPVAYLETFRLLNPEPGKLFVGNAQNAAKLEKLVGKIKGMELNLMRRAYGPYSAKAKQEAQEGLLVLRPILARAIIIKNGLTEAQSQSKAIDAGQVPAERSDIDFSSRSGSQSLLQKHMKK